MEPTCRPDSSLEAEARIERQSRTVDGKWNMRASDYYSRLVVSPIARKLVLGVKAVKRAGGRTGGGEKGVASPAG